MKWMMISEVIFSIRKRYCPSKHSPNFFMDVLKIFYFTLTYDKVGKPTSYEQN